MTKPKKELRKRVVLKKRNRKLQKKWGKLQLKPKKRINSRAKGKRGELDFSYFLKERGIPARRGQQFRGGTDSPDVVAGGCLSDVHIEVKNVEAGNPYKWLDQACADADITKTPVVAHRKSGKRWIAILDMRDFVNIMEALVSKST